MSCTRGCCPDHATHYRSLVMNGAPSGQRAVVEREGADLDAYRRLRANGLQPPSHVGAADLEKAATTPFEVESGQVIRNERLAKQAQAVHELAKDPATFKPLEAS